MAIDKIIRPDGEIPIFGGESEADELKIFGTETESVDITALLTNQNAKDGWASGVDANGFPALSWFNAVGHTFSYITALYLQDGITDWNTNQSYYTNSLAKSTVNGFTYISKTGTAPSTPNPGTNDPSTDSTNWRLAFLDSANTVTFVPTADYHPSTKKYVDDAIAGISITGVLTTDDFLHIQDQKAEGTNAGASIAGTQQRDLNTVLTNTISGASLSSDDIILPTGKYYIEARVPSFRAGTAIAHLYNITDASEEVWGQNAGSTSLADFTYSEVSGIFEIAAVKTFKINHFTQLAYDSGALGLGSRIDGLSNVEIYTDVRIWKVG